ncbi:hypothetical protein BKA82DRAFT_1005775, partial [Pisolithus tinctorius]
MGAKRVLEVRTLGGYSTIYMAQGLPEDGELITLETSEAFYSISTDAFARVHQQL